MLAGLTPAVYKALDLDVSLDTLVKHSHQFKTLQDRFRQAWRVTALGDFGEFKDEFATLMDRMDAARASSLTAPERFFKKAQKKINDGHYDFGVDFPKKPGRPTDFENPLLLNGQTTQGGYRRRWPDFSIWSSDKARGGSSALLGNQDLEIAAATTRSALAPVSSVLSGDVEHLQGLYIAKYFAAVPPVRAKTFWRRDNRAARDAGIKHATRQWTGTPG